MRFSTMALAPRRRAVIAVYLGVCGLLSFPVSSLAQEAAEATTDEIAQPASAENPESFAPENWNAHFQATYVWQRKNAFPAAYSGKNSLTSDREKSYSFSTTAFFGFRPWAGGELYFNPEAARGVPLSNLQGLGGFSNGEIARTSGPTLKFYRARLFLRQTWGMGGGSDKVESDQNQLAGYADKRRFVLTVGNVAVPDIFDDNSYSHDPRTQFLNWSIMSHGAYDFAADARGYTWGVAGEWFYDDWVIRAGRFTQPDEPNQQPMDLRIFKHYGDQIELERAHKIGDQPGKLRLLAFHNRTKMSRYQDALNLAASTGAGTVPSINLVRTGEQDKYGVGVSLEQAITSDIGVFGRASWADGKTETYAFTEIDHSVSGGTLIKGGSWGRAQDALGFAFARNGLSKVHREYLADAGMGFFIGDGALNYRPEQIYEAFYSVAVNKAVSVTFDLQHIRNPAYNANRGPVNLGAVRLHAEF